MSMTATLRRPAEAPSPNRGTPQARKYHKLGIGAGSAWRMNMRFLIRLARTALAIAALAASIGWTSVDALALTKKESAINKCDQKYARCIAKCDNLVDVYTQVRDCNNACIIRQSRCLLNAGLRVQDAPMLETQPDPLQSQ
jgi:hypothetical protein